MSEKLTTRERTDLLKEIFREDDSIYHKGERRKRFESELRALLLQVQDEQNSKDVVAITNYLKKRGWTKQSKALHSDLAVAILNAPRAFNPQPEDQ